MRDLRVLSRRIADRLDPSDRGVQWRLRRRVDLSAHRGGTPPTLDALVSQACSAAQFAEPVYLEWVAAMGQQPKLHRKQWEYTVVFQAARQAGALRAGARACGFGVGVEPISAVLAAHGVRVVATDQPLEYAGDWAVNDEHATSIEAMQWPSVCPPERFRELVTFRPVNMNHVPDDLGTDFDIVWSSCAIEHLGSPELGLRFARRSLELLAPGGIAVHTTELDLTPGRAAVDYGHCALYRLSDLERFRDEVRAAGFEMEINPYVAMDSPADRFIAPRGTVGDEEFHLKLALFESISTSFAIVVRRPA